MLPMYGRSCPEEAVGRVNTNTTSSGTLHDRISYNDMQAPLSIVAIY